MEVTNVIRHNLTLDFGYNACLTLIPLTMDASALKKEILYPLAKVILGGFNSSTLLDIVVVLVVPMRLGKVL